MRPRYENYAWHASMNEAVSELDDLHVNKHVKPLKIIRQAAAHVPNAGRRQMPVVIVSSHTSAAVQVHNARLLEQEKRIRLTYHAQKYCTPSHLLLLRYNVAPTLESG